MYLDELKIKNHPILKDICFDFVNPQTNEPYSVVAFVGENGCGKTTLLNEIFKYNDSEYIQDKKEVYDVVPRPFNALYLRQGSLHKNSMKEVRKLIDGKDMYPINSVTFTDGENPYALKNNNVINRVDKCIPILQKLGDEAITNVYKENHIGEVYCSYDVSKKIDGKDHGYDINNYSSGQQEILLKLKDLKNMAVGTDCVLLDEPETSLHPRWQKEIVNIIKSMLDTSGAAPQLFLSTHSEKVLESLIKDKDALIIRLYKEDGIIKHEMINQMNLVLPKPTFAELDYTIFKIDSFEYCSELYDLLEWRLDAKGDYGVDREIKQSNFYNETIHYKEWYNDKAKKVTTHTLPIYVRNYFHHPKDRVPPTDEELHLAIELLRDVILNLKQK